MWCGVVSFQNCFYLLLSCTKHDPRSCIQFTAHMHSPKSTLLFSASTLTFNLTPLLLLHLLLHLLFSSLLFLILQLPLLFLLLSYCLALPPALILSCSSSSCSCFFLTLLAQWLCPDHLHGSSGALAERNQRGKRQIWKVEKEEISFAVHLALYYAILHHTALHYTTLHYTTLHCTTMHFTK